MKKNKKILLALAGIALLVGCSRAAKYNVDYQGMKNCYIGAKDSYAAGTRVKLKYDLIATDTDYTFYLDDEKIDYSYEDNMFIIEFVMPQHDVTIRCETENTMTMDTSVE